MKKLTPDQKKYKQDLEKYNESVKRHIEATKLHIEGTKLALKDSIDQMNYHKKNIVILKKTLALAEAGLK